MGWSLAVKNFGKDMVVAALGLATSLLTALLLWWIEHQFEISVYGWTLWFVIPVGAICAGVVAASGYFVGGRLFGIRPTWRVLVSMLVVSVGCYFLIYYLSYQSAEVQDPDRGLVRLPDVISFGQYLEWDIENLSIGRIGRDGSTGSLGAWGYGLAALQVIGFMLGGLGVYLFLAAVPYCEECSQYLKKGSVTLRDHSDVEALESGIQGLAELAPSGWAGRLEGLGEKSERGASHRTKVTERFCNTCPARTTTVEVEVEVKVKNREWQSQFDETAPWRADEVAESAPAEPAD